ncbi:hypothetical protein [Macrococcus animalis]|uniref:hypothetical protein n=1 Tax=Macrococcus animalis TaxID=3395467 RepID=UPI0039BE2910
MSIRIVLLIFFLTIGLIGNIYSVITGLIMEDYKEVIGGCYGLSILGLLLMFWIETSEGYTERKAHQTLLIGLCSMLLILAIGLLIGMFLVDYSWFMRILEILMILLLSYSLIKAIKRR